MTRTHPVTGAILVRGTRAITLHFGNQFKVVDLPGWYAANNLTGAYGLHDPQDMTVSDEALLEMKVESGRSSDGGQSGA